MKRKYIIFTLILAALATWSSCKQSFLDVKPAGSLDQSLLANKNGLDALLVGAYSMLPGTKTWNWTWEAASSNWVYGSIRGMEANKGTDSGDQPDINPIMTYSETSTNPYLNLRWRAIYEGVSRTNGVITVTNKALAAGTITQADADLYIAQARALRGWYHFEAWRMWDGKIPYLDENTDPGTVTNGTDVRQKILDDLNAGLALPLNMGAIGKFNKTVVQVILGKAMMQMNHDYAGALPILQDAATNGTQPAGGAIGLYATYGDIFDIANRNCKEAIYTVQYSVNDNSGAKNGGDGEVLNFPYKGGGSPGGCCGFFNPTQEFVNSFRTVGGLPMLDNSYDTPAEMVKNDFGVPATKFWSSTTSYDSAAVVTILDADGLTEHYYESNIKANVGNDPTSSATWTFKQDWHPYMGEVDPRLDWSVGRKGIPYWDWGKVTGADWKRDPTYDGPYSPKKQVYKKSQEGTYTEVGNWTSGWTANGYRMIRYSDLLLLIAECQIEKGTPDLAAACGLINQVRARAANSAGWVSFGAGPAAATYVINQYPTGGAAPFDTQANARKALYMERKLELGQEGHRWFDLNRWGITVAELGRALAYEKTQQWGGSCYGSATVGADAVYYPIPQRQIDLSNGNLVQIGGK